MATTESASTVADSLDILVDESVGIIRSIESMPVEPAAPRFHHCEARLSDVHALGGEPCQTVASAAAVERSAALNAAAAKAVACYAAALYDRDSLPLASFADADFSCVRPADFALFNAGQYEKPGFPYVPATDDTPLRWASAVDLISGETISVPAAFVFHPYAFYRRGGDKPIAPPTAAGLACGNSVAEAALEGLAEVICHDAMALFWQSMTAPPQLTVQSLTAPLKDMLARLASGGDGIVILDITSDNAVPAFVAVLRSRDRERPAHVCGAGADLDPTRALVKAVARVAEARRLCRMAGRYPVPPTPANDWEDMVEPLDHLTVAADHDRSESFHFATGSDIRRDFDEYESRSTDSVDADLETMVRLVATTGYRPCVANLTSADLAIFGITVCRVVIPGYLPVFASYRLRVLGGSRLYEVPQKLGYRGIARSGPDNPVPHPFAL